MEWEDMRDGEDAPCDLRSELFVIRELREIYAHQDRTVWMLLGPGGCREFDSLEEAKQAAELTVAKKSS